MSDATPEMLEIAKNNVPEANTKIIRLPEMIEGKYDAIFCRHVLHHLPWQDFFQSLETIACALERDGQAGLIFPISKNDETIVQPYILGEQTMERNFYPLAHIRDAIQSAGLMIQKEYAYTEQDELKDIRCIYQTILRPV